MTQVVAPQVPENSPGVRFVNTPTLKQFTSLPVKSQGATQTYYLPGPGALWLPPNQQPFSKIMAMIIFQQELLEPHKKRQDILVVGKERNKGTAFLGCFSCLV